MALDIHISLPKFGPTGVNSDASEQTIHKISRRAVLSVVLAFTFFVYFGIGLTQDFSLGLGMIAMYLVLPAMFLARNLTVDWVKLGAYLVFVYCVLLTKLSATGPNISSSSMYYLIVIYFPFIFALAQKNFTDKLYAITINFFLKCMFLISIVAVVQFSSQFLVKIPWAFNISLIIPREIADRGVWNTDYNTGIFQKANGFFLREPSELSTLLGFAILIELLYLRRMARIVTYSLAILLSFSGTGIFIALAGLLVPVRLKAAIRAIIIVVLGVTIVPAFDSYLLGGFFLGRLHEFGVEGTSAWARFVAPQYLVSAGMSSYEKTMFGNGSGSLSSAAVTYARVWYDGRWEIHGPTWAKLTYEYGIIGTGAGVIFMIICLWRSRGPFELKFALFYGWLASGGQLLSPSYCALMFAIVVIWPTSRSWTISNVSKSSRNLHA